MYKNFEAIVVYSGRNQLAMFFRRFIVQIMICILMIQCFQLCIAISSDNNLQLPRIPSTTASTIWTQLTSIKKNATQPTLAEDEVRALRLNMFGGRNMTINLTNLVVLGLGMAAAVSLFSFMETPGLNLKRSMPDESLIEGLFTTIFNEDLINQVEKKLNPKDKFSDWLLKDHYQYKSSADQTPNIKQNLFDNFREFLSDPNMMNMLLDKNT